jgi:hypothetical protein
MVDLYAELIRISYEFEPMPDDVSDHLGGARAKLVEAVAAATVHSGADIAWKLRLAAMLTEDDDGGPMVAEADVLNAALEDLEELRDRGRGLTYRDVFPIGAVVIINGYPPLTIGRHVDELPGVELLKDGESCMTANPHWLVEIGAAVHFPEVAA